MFDGYYVCGAVGPDVGSKFEVNFLHFMKKTLNLLASP